MFHTYVCVPVLIMINLRGTHVEMADLHATTILYMDFRNIMYYIGADHLMGWIFIEPNNFLNLLMLLDIFLSFKALERLFYFVGTYTVGSS
jgi:hypothetical protein